MITWRGGDAPPSSSTATLNSLHSTPEHHEENAITMASTKAYPPGGTFLDTVKKSFTDVPVDKEKDNAVSTSEFLEAAESLTTLFGALDSSNHGGCY